MIESKKLNDLNSEVVASKNKGFRDSENIKTNSVPDLTDSDRTAVF